MLHPGIVINFTIEQGEIAYYDFRCNVILEGDSESSFREEVNVAFWVDGSLNLKLPIATVMAEDAAIPDGDEMQFSLSLHSNDTLSPGDHGIQIILDPYVYAAPVILQV